jgi:hypothetical protein
MSPADDPLDDLLAPPPPLPRRDDVFARTLPALRWGRRLRQVGRAAALAAAYAAGLLTSPGGPPHPQADAPAVVQAAPPGPPAATDLEWQALERPAAAAALYREAGDQYLAGADPEEAVRCYGNALDAGGAGHLEVSTQDTWLLMAIKHARKKEKNACEK